MSTRPSSLRRGSLLAALLVFETVLLVVGENDPMGPHASRRIAESLPADAAELQVLPDCGHWIHVEAPELVLAALDAWLPQIPPRAQGEQP